MGNNDIYSQQKEVLKVLLQLQQQCDNRTLLQVSHPREPPPNLEPFECIVTVCTNPILKVHDKQWPRADNASGNLAHEFNKANLGDAKLSKCGCELGSTKRHLKKCNLEKELLKSYRSEDLYGFGWKQYTVWFRLKAAAPSLTLPNPAPHDITWSSCILSIPATQEKNSDVVTISPLRGLSRHSTGGPCYVGGEVVLLQDGDERMQDLDALDYEMLDYYAAVLNDDAQV